MPLEKGNTKSAIGHNIKEMERSGHSQKQSVAAALHTAKDAASEVIPASMSIADVNAKNKQYWEPAWGADAGKDDLESARPSVRAKDMVYDSSALDHVRESKQEHGGEGEELGQHDKKTKDQPTSPTGVASPSEHQGMAQANTNFGPVGDDNGPEPVKLGVPGAQLGRTRHEGMAQDTTSPGYAARAGEFHEHKGKTGSEGMVSLPLKPSRPRGPGEDSTPAERVARKNANTAKFPQVGGRVGGKQGYTVEQPDRNRLVAVHREERATGEQYVEK